MADQPTLTAAALHNAIVTLAAAYGGALADKDRDIALLKGQLEMARGMLAATTKELTELRSKKKEE